MKLAIICYLIGFLGFIHQSLMGYPFDKSQLGGVHHETLIVFFWMHATFFLGRSPSSKVVEEIGK